MYLIFLCAVIFFVECFSLNITLRYPPPSVRNAPDGYHGRNFGKWPVPSTSQTHGVFYVTHSSCTDWQENMVNLHAEYQPISQNNDSTSSDMTELLSWSTCSYMTQDECKRPNAISTLLGDQQSIGAQGPTDIKYSAAWNYQTTASSDNRSLKFRRKDAVIAYGEEKGRAWMVQYSDWYQGYQFCQGPQINVMSKKKNGVSEDLADDIIKQMIDLDDELNDLEFRDVVQRIRILKVDDRRS